MVQDYFHGKSEKYDLEMLIPQLIEENEKLWATKSFYAPAKKWHNIWTKYRNRANAQTGAQFLFSKYFGMGKTTVKKLRQCHLMTMAIKKEQPVTYQTFYNRMYRLGWDEDKAIKTPAHVEKRDKDRRRKVKIHKFFRKLRHIFHARRRGKGFKNAC